jgi:tubulin polyglutamylase TTLL4
VNQKEGILASKYIMDPHLLNGFKYDLRVYVLVTNFNPLKVYIYDDGLVRFATEKYSKDTKTLGKKFVHLTNFSINKRSTNFVKNADQAKKTDKGKKQDGD